VWIRSLLERGVAVVWASTWEHAANTHFAPLLGIPPLPVATITTPNDLPAVGGAPEWKSHQLAAQFQGRPLVWIDDSPDPALPALRTARHDAAPVLVVKANPTTGLTEEIRAQVDAWLALASTPAGLEVLAAERRRAMRRERQARWRRRRAEAARARRDDELVVEGLALETVHLGLDAASHAELLAAREAAYADPTFASRRAAGAHLVVEQLRRWRDAATSVPQRAGLDVLIDATAAWAAAVSYDSPADLVPAPISPDACSEIPLRSQIAIAARVDAQVRRVLRAWPWAPPTEQAWRAVWSALLPRSATQAVLERRTHIDADF
jgi:hypothetical protein